MDRNSRAIEIVGSVFGAMGDPGQWSEFSCIQDDGHLEEERFAYFMRTFANDGASATREIPFLVDDRGHIRQVNYMPFHFDEKKCKYDLNRFNPVYFNNLRRMATIANRFGMRFYFSIFDRCHGLMPHSPWRLNLQDIDGWYDKKARPYLKTWVLQIIATLRDNVYGIELENEPRDPGFAISGVETMKILKHHGVNDHHILTGIEFMPPDNHYYRSFKKELRKAGLYQKKRQFSVVHNVTEHLLEEYKHVQKHTRRYWFSDDGRKPKHNAEWWERHLTKFFSYRRPLRNQAFKKKFAFEHLYRFKDDDIHGVLGIARAYYNATGIKLWGRFDSV